MFAQGNPFQLCILFRTPVYVTGSYLLLLLFFTFDFLMQGFFKQAFLVAFAVTASLMVHEFGHVFAARLNGHRSRVVLVMMGAVTIPEGESTGWQGIRLSLAGPAAGFLLALISFYGFAPANSMNFWDYALGGYYPATDTLWPFLQLVLVRIGVIWSIFNLLPILPMDGGHAMRDFLGLFMRAYKADAIAARVSLVAAVPIVAWCLQNRFNLAAIIVGFMAWQSFQSLSSSRK